MALPTNVLQTVQTYQDSGLAYLLNAFCFINLANKKFKDFEQREANLGDTVTFDLPPRYTTQQGLVVTFQDSQQRVQPLTVSQASNTSYAFSNQQFIFNVRDYMEKFGKSAVLEIGSAVEADVAKNIISGVVNQNTSLLQTNSGPYRFFGDGITPINSFGQLAQALANFRDYGAAKDQVRGILPMTVVPPIVNSGLNQFVWDRNEELSMSWMLGQFSACDWYQSNLLPIHVSGTVGNSNQTLTLVSTNDPTGQNVTQLTFSGATANDLNAIKSGDLLQFQDGVSGQPNLRYLTFIGHQPSSQPVQFRATANAAADGAGNVIINITPSLVWFQNQNQNLNNSLAAGMQVKALPTHRAGVIYSGNALFLGMPKLPEEIPFPTANKSDKESGASMRMYYGSLFGQNQRGFVHDIIWGSTMVPEYSMRLIFPM
jgi:hypothetical protein